MNKYLDSMGEVSKVDNTEVRLVAEAGTEAAEAEVMDKDNKGLEKWVGYMALVVDKLVFGVE